MASDLMKELLENTNNLTDILKKLRYISKVLDNKQLLNWVTSEIEGYNQKDDLPLYRIFKSPFMYYSGINGNVQFSETALDINYFLDKDIRKEVENLLVAKVSCPIVQIEDSIKNKDSNGLIIDYSFLCNQLASDSGIIASKIYLRISKSKLIEIENVVFNKIQDIIIELERTVGIEQLNSLIIDLDKVEIEGCNRNINVIITNGENSSEDKEKEKQANKLSLKVTIISIIATIVVPIITSVLTYIFTVK